ncbi:hypothetical protein HYFRA_00011553 [Hymenoscyphus fraxineus]|uniref:Uncharacterized protein n=1 Tax=Hymenoscyphus fraxineus TaxID=746836 RepID=A0A9N9L524_9HELO|nr:hypothetical protein HYFRA_00011553 [Hymenoscyphus fraxineus]
MFENFVPRHIPILLVSTTIIFGGSMPLFNAEKACRTFGFPQRIAVSKAAWPPMIVGSARTSVMGIALWGMYLGDHFEAMDILCLSMGWLAVIDGYVCWKEAGAKTGALRVLSASLVALWGLLGMTAGG